MRRTSTSSLDDAKAYQLLASGETLGVFQLDGGPMRDLLRRMVLTTFEDISAVLAAPGDGQEEEGGNPRQGVRDFFRWHA